MSTFGCLCSITSPILHVGSWHVYLPNPWHIDYKCTTAKAPCGNRANSDLISVVDVAQGMDPRVHEFQMQPNTRGAMECYPCKFTLRLQTLPGLADAKKFAECACYA
jgi:hypothetical protein